MQALPQPAGRCLILWCLQAEHNKQHAPSTSDTQQNKHLEPVLPQCPAAPMELQAADAGSPRRLPCKPEDGRTSLQQTDTTAFRPAPYLCPKSFQELSAVDEDMVREFIERPAKYAKSV